MRRFLPFSLIVVGAVLAGGVSCGGGDEAPAPTPTLSIPAIATAASRQVTISFTSPAFGDGETIPVKYTCDGENVSPPLEWGQPPTGTESLALAVDDPGAPSGKFVHWAIYDLPATLRSLPEGVPTDGSLPDGSFNGENGAGKLGYTGPCPPSGTHRYVFRLFALDTKLDAGPGLSEDQLLRAVMGHALANAEFGGVYGRSP
jgi:Raf kinase inhibitor-like YbhB/YbcL family protein